jgi:hypothetical protein
MNKPEKIKICNVDYAVVWTDGDWSVKTGFRGAIDYHEQIIRILPTLPPQMMAETMMHEITHGLIQFFQPGDEDVKQERLSEIIGAGLPMVWRDNPEAFAWWTELIV